MTYSELKPMADLIAIMDKQRKTDPTSQSVWAYIFAATSDETAADNVQEVIGTSFDQKDSGYIIDRLNQFIIGYRQGLNQALREQGYGSDVIPPH